MNTQADSRTQVNEAIEQIEQRKRIIANYIVSTLMPDEVKETLDVELEDLSNAANSLRFVLDEHYKARCAVCEDRLDIETEYPGTYTTCIVCEEKAIERREELRDDANGR